MKWVMTNLFHGGQYEYCYSHIGMGSHNLEFFARLYPTDSSYLHQPDYRLDTVHRTPNHHRHSAVCRTQRQAPARCLSSPVSKIPLAAGSPVETLGAVAHRTVLSCWYDMDRFGRYHFPPHRPKHRWRRLVERPDTVHRLPGHSLLGTEPCGADAAGDSSLGRRAAGIAHQCEAAPQKWPRPYRTCPTDACRGKELVSRKTVYDLCRRLLRHAGRLWCGIYPPHQPHATRCGHLRIAQEETQTSKRAKAKTRQAAGNTDSNSFSGKILAPCKDSGTGQNQVPAGLFQGGNLVQGFSLSGVVGNKPRSCGQGKGRLFLYNRSEPDARRGYRRFCRSLEHRGCVQEYQAVSGQRRTADMEGPRPGACGGDKPVALFGGLGLVYPVWPWQDQTAGHTVVSLEELSELSGCVGRAAACALAETNYSDVRQSYRTCANYRVLY